jgi:hypothetical protein
MQSRENIRCTAEKQFDRGCVPHKAMINKAVELYPPIIARGYPAKFGFWFRIKAGVKNLPPAYIIIFGR